MNKPIPSPFDLPEGFAGAQKSIEAMSRAYSDWLQNANRVQAEMIRFIGERFSKDAQLVTRFAACRQPDELLKLQADAMAELANDYMKEGARIFTLFTEASQATADELGRSAGPRRPR